MTDCSGHGHEVQEQQQQQHQASLASSVTASSQATETITDQDGSPPEHRQVSPTADARFYHVPAPPPPPQGARGQGCVQQSQNCLSIASPVTLEEARLAASRMKQLSSHYQNATLNSPTPSPASAPPLTKFTAIAPAPQGRPRPLAEYASSPAPQAQPQLATYLVPIAAARPTGTVYEAPSTYPIPIAAAHPTGPVNEAPSTKVSSASNAVPPRPSEGGYYASQSSQMQEARYQDISATASTAIGNKVDPTSTIPSFARHPRKHRRTGSYGNSLSYAHRSAFSNRATAFLKSNRNHTREDSAGLDILSAAVEGISQDELAAVAGSGQKPTHKRDESVISAFGSLGSLDFKRLLNNISPTPDEKEAQAQMQGQLSGARTATDQPPKQAPAPGTAQQDRAPSPPTPMISNICRPPQGNANKPSGNRNLSIPVFEQRDASSKISSNYVVSSIATAQPTPHQVSHIRHPSPATTTATPTVAKANTTAMEAPPQVLAQVQTQRYVHTTPAQTQLPEPIVNAEAARPLKKQHRRHMSSFSTFFSTSASTAPAAAGHQHHTRDPSETSKMLMQLERKIDQDVAQYTKQESRPPQGMIASPQVLTSPEQPRSYIRQVAPVNMQAPPQAPPVPPRVMYATLPAAGVLPVCVLTTQQHAPPPLQYYAAMPPLQHPMHPQIMASPAPERHSMPPPRMLVINHQTPPEASPLSNNLMRHSSPSHGQVPVVAKVGTKQQQNSPKISSTTCPTESAPDSAGKRVRRKCAVPDCANRVVQGGRCISHGARRKQCGHPDCDKNVKKAGMCSSHGPARKRCEIAGCSKVAVQGGKCITHGARKKLCCVPCCEKQGIINGHCKKHYDEYAGSRARKTSRPSVVAVAPNPNHKAGGLGRAAATTSPIKSTGNTTKTVRMSSEADTGGGGGRESIKGHTRGLSVFYDMSAVNAITSDETPAPSASAGESSGAYTSTQMPIENGSKTTRKRKAHARGLSIFSDDNISNAIISGALNDNSDVN
jgi:hypothetical protein